MVNEIHMNQKCTIVLRERGVEALNKHYSNLHMEPPEKYEVGQEYSAELWQIMNIFGSYTYMGPPTPFHLNIKITGAKLLD